MNVQITARGYKAPERLKAYLESKISRLNRFEEHISDIKAVFSYENLDQVIELSLKVNNKKILITEKTDDVFKSIDLAIDNAERQVARTREKIKTHDNKKIVENLNV